jgi:hypothetical protein
MLEVRYNTETKRLTAWCGDQGQFSNLDRGRDNEAIAVLNIPIPEKTCSAYLFDEATQTLTDNPDYIEPEPPPSFIPQNLALGVDQRVTHIEAFLKQIYPEVRT